MSLRALRQRHPDLLEHEDEAAALLAGPDDPPQHECAQEAELPLAAALGAPLAVDEEPERVIEETLNKDRVDDRYCVWNVCATE